MEKRSCREPESLYDRTRIGRMYFRWIGGIMSLFVLSMLCLSCKTDWRQGGGIRPLASFVGSG